MNFKEAMSHAVDNHEEIDDDQICVVGVSYQPNHSDGEFQIVSLSYQAGSDDEDVDGLSDLDSEIWLEEETEDDYDLDNERERNEIFGADHDEAACYKAEINGGNVLGSEGIEDYHNCPTIDDLLQELPNYAPTLNYQVYNVSATKLNMATEHILKLLFPELPSINDHDKDMNLTEFRAAAIKLVTELNKTN